jgi:hypothetical protein
MDITSFSITRKGPTAFINALNTEAQWESLNEVLRTII